MKNLQARPVVVLFLIVSSLSAVSALLSSPQSAPLVVRPEGARRQPSTPSQNLYAEAAEALRRGNLQEARQELDSIAARHPDQSQQTRVVAGLYAHEAGKTELAGQLLAAVPASTGPLEDWRLYLLARDAAGRGETELARSHYDRLIAGNPDSPLRPLAFLEAAKLAADHDQPRAALDLIADARKAELGGEVKEDLEKLAWRIGQQLADEEVQRQAARHFLVDEPLSSDAVQVVRTFRALDGEVDWQRLLSPQDILRRAESFLAGDSSRAALLTLDEVAEGERGFEWHLIRARALTEGGDGRQALALLGTLVPSDTTERASLDWQRVLTLAEAGESDTAAVYLARLVSSHTRLQLSDGSLRRLYRDFLEAGFFEPAVDTLRLLRRIDPADETGAADLWERGWRESQRGNPEGAVRYWSVLAEIYPEDGDAQRGRYWQARALEDLGRNEEAREIYRQMVASSDTTDFYARQAVARLGEIPLPEGAALAQAPAGAWPAEPDLRRVKLLTDLGLDDLASQEIELAADHSNRRDVLALKGLILCHKGDQRSGLVLLREAFPALGGPYQSIVPAEVLFAYYPLEYGDEIRAFARETGLPGHLIAGIIRQESAFDPRATSPVGARGLMQLMPETAREVSRKVGVPYSPSGLYNPEISVHLGAVYFRELLDRFDGNVELALASYNGGPNRIHRMWKESGPDARLADFVEKELSLDESRNYVKRILVLADSYRQLYPSLG
jgi:soluble lytic murein transglycosylase-like protein